MTTLRSTLLRLLGLMAALLALSGPVYASATAGNIKGTVIDDGGLAIPGALVTLTSPSLIGGAQQRTSGADGDFFFTELPPGQYTVTAQKQPFATVKKTGVVVAIARTTQITVEMTVGGEELTIEQAKPVVDTEKASSGQNFNKEFLTRIPSGRSYQAIVTQTAGVNGGANPTSGGASTNENTFLLDGVNTTDPVTGTFSLNFNFDAIEEIEVITGGFDPEYGESLGAVISVVTKSGGNTLEVITNGFLSRGNWGVLMDARNAADGYEIAPTGFDESASTVQAATTVSGPILKDKVWFLGSYEYNRTMYSNVGIALPRDFDGHYFFGKITAQPSSAHRFTLQFTTNPTTIDNIDQSDTRILPEAQGRQAQGGFLTSAKWNWFINPEANLETQASVQKVFIDVAGVPCTHDTQLGYNPCEANEAENTTDFVTPGREGLFGAYNSANYGSYYFDDRWRGEVSSKLALLQVDDPFGGKHDIKAGVESSYVLWDQVSGYNGDLLYYDLFENPFDPSTYTNYYWIETSGASIYRSTGFHFGTFVQDVYKPIENLTFRYGLRYDRAVMRNDANEPIVDVGVFGPRAYAVWDPWNDQKTKIYGGYGRFNDTGRLSIASYLSQSNLGYKLFVGEFFDNTGGSAAGQSAQDVSTANTIRVNEDGVASPYSDEFSLGMQREVIPDVSVGVDFTGKFTRNVYSFDETNLIYDQDGFTYIGSGDGSLDLRYRLRTPAIAQRDYYQTDFSVQRNFAQRWLMFGTYSYVVSKGRVQDSVGGALANPAQVELMYGNLPYDIRHQVKFQAAWDIPNDPWTTKLGTSVQYFSGAPITRYYYSDASSVTQGGDAWALLKQPRGSYGRTNGNWELSVLAQQEIPVRKGKLAATAQIDNVTNNQYAIVYNGFFVSSENRYVIAYRQSPVSAQVGLKYTF
jgi:hypothetical protein